MNKIVVPHYPVEQLPADLRAGLDTGAFVTVTLDPDPADDRAAADENLTLDELFALSEKLPRKTIEQIVKEVRAIRDEWD